MNHRVLRYFHCIRALSKTEPRGHLEGARAARAKNRIDTSGGLAEIKIRITTRCFLWIRIGWCRQGRRDRTNITVQCAAITGQVRNVENIEAFSNQIESDLFTYPYASCHTQIVREKTVVTLEFRRQNDERQRRSHSVPLRTLRNIAQICVF